MIRCFKDQVNREQPNGNNVEMEVDPVYIKVLEEIITGMMRY